MKDRRIFLVKNFVFSSCNGKVLFLKKDLIRSIRQIRRNLEHKGYSLRYCLWLMIWKNRCLMINPKDLRFLFVAN